MNTRKMHGKANLHRMTRFILGHFGPKSLHCLITSHLPGQQDINAADLLFNFRTGIKKFQHV
jgi:hypothetical protein